MEYAADNDTSFLQLSDETKEFVARYLHSIDVNGDGVITQEKLEECMQKLGFFPTKEDLKWLINHFDTNKNGKLEIQELLDNLHIINAHSLNGDEMIEAFKIFDRDGDGFIRCEELVKALTYNNGFPISEARSLTDHIIRTFDKNGDGKLNYSEFVEIFMSRQYPFQARSKTSVDHGDSSSTKPEDVPENLDPDGPAAKS